MLKISISKERIVIMDLFTSESVTEGHPDKICDQISDAILDAALTVDSTSRVACECLITDGLLLISGELTTKADIDFKQVAKETLKDIGVLDIEKYKIEIVLKAQSQDIALGVNRAVEFDQGSKDHLDSLGAGDQGLMFGYACNETDTYMPISIFYAHKLAKQLAYVRKNKMLNYLLPDGKTQVTFSYKNGVPHKAKTIVVSAQHDESVAIKDLRNDIFTHVILPIIPTKFIDSSTVIHINPTGRFVIGGPQADCGLTGRKIIVDTYGGYTKHGGGAFSGKDPSKVDRSAAYMARHIAKNLVEAGVAKQCEIQMAYAIGIANPVSLSVTCFGSSQYLNADIAEAIKKTYDLRPKAIIEYLQLDRPIYRNLAAYGHFGREENEAAWEKINKKKQKELLGCLCSNNPN